MERVRGFSPAQWALGRSPNWDQSFFDSDNETPDPSFLEHLQGMETAREAWLKARNDARIKRASRSRDRPLARFRPGDEVDFWRRGKGKGTRPHIKGRFHGGAVVLATSTEIDEEDGSRKPRKVVWITHAGTLIKCAPEHLRYSSERARQLANMGQAQRLPWTHEGLDGWLRKGQYESLPITDTPDDRSTDEDEEGVKDDSSAAWEQETRQAKRKLEMQPSSSSSLARPRTEAALMSKPSNKTRKQEPRAVFLSMDVTSSASQQRRFVNRPGQFVASQLRKRKVEVSVKNLSQDELRQLEQAKQNEIRNYLQNEVMELLKGDEQIREDELMGMRWVVTVKHFPEKKVKARLVILGYQAKDLEDELLEAATPTPTRRAKHCFLQVAAHHGFELKKADVSGAFLQGREQQADRYVVPVNELADALGITRGKPARLRKAGYGLVIAPKEWVESVYEELREMGLVQCKTDPCVWKLVKETPQGPLLQVLVLFHIDDFMLAGRKGKLDGKNFNRMRNKLKWSEWEEGHLRMTGVDVSQLQDGSFLMDQKAYVDNIDPAEINPERRKTPEASVTEREKSSLRGLWGAMQWPCTQTDAKRACAISMLQSSLPVATVGTLMKSNRILKEMKSDLVEIRVHAHRNEKLAVVSWSDAAWANRRDLSSTLGFFSGITTTRILQGGRHGVTPIHHRSGKSKRKARSSLSAEVQALADAEQELYLTRLQLPEFLGYSVNLSNVDETVQRVEGILVIDAKAIYDSMYGASGPLAMEEKRTAIEMMGIQEGIRRQNAILRWCHGEANLSDGLTKETAKTQLERFYDNGCVWSLVHDEEMVSARKRRQQGKQPLDEETSGPKRDLDKEWVEICRQITFTKLRRTLTKMSMNEHL